MTNNNRMRWLALGGGLLLAAALGLAFRPARQAVDTGTAARGPLVVTIDEEGRTRIRERYVVSAPLAGRLLRVTLEPGDAVQAEQTVIAAIEPADASLLDPRAHAAAAARVKAAETERERMRPLLLRARASHDYQAAELERATRLFAAQGISRQELDAANERAAAATAELESAELQALIAGYELEVAQAALIASENRGGEGSDRFEIRSPISGTVLRLLQESERVVEPGAPLVEVGNPSEIEIVVETLSNDAVRIVRGARVEIAHWGGDSDLAGRVRIVEPAGFTKISALGVEEQRVNVIVDFTGPPEARRAVGDGFRVEARIVEWESGDVLRIPVGALFREGESWAVFRVAAGRAVVQNVRIGHRNSREAEVIDGLSPGDEVVLHPGDQLRNGSRIRRR